MHIGGSDGGVARDVECGSLYRQRRAGGQVCVATDVERAAHIAAGEGVGCRLRSTKDATTHTCTGGHRFGLRGHLIFTGNDVQIATGLDVGIAGNVGIGAGQGDVVGCFGLQVAAYSQTRLDLVNRLSFLSRYCRGPDGICRARFERSGDIPDGVKGDVATRLQVCVVTGADLRTNVLDVASRFE